MHRWIICGWILTGLNYFLLLLGFLIGLAYWIEIIFIYRKNSLELKKISIFPLIREPLS
jgi:hypothetical protein